MSLMTVLAVIYGIKKIAEQGLEWLAIASIAAGIGSASPSSSARAARRAVDRPQDVPAAGVQHIDGDERIGFFVMFGIFLMIAQYLQLVLGLSPLIAGLWTIPSSLGFTVGSILTPILARRASPATVIAVGAIVAALGFALLTQVGGTSGLGNPGAGVGHLLRGPGADLYSRDGHDRDVRAGGAGRGGLGDLGDRN